jgi:hypothetical protein
VNLVEPEFIDPVLFKLRMMSNPAISNETDTDMIQKEEEDQIMEEE